MAERGRPKGYPKSGGRKKGVQPQREDVIAMLARLNFDPHERLVHIARVCEEMGDYVTAANCCKELAQYKAPKLRAIEHSGDVAATLAITRITETIIDPADNGGA